MPLTPSCKPDAVFIFDRSMPPGHARRMAHDRVAPAGYVEAFRPNVRLDEGKATVFTRKVPLTAEEVRAIEASWRES